MCYIYARYVNLTAAYQVSSTILSLDGITTKKNGTIVKMGTFDELIVEKCYFYSLFTISQQPENSVLVFGLRV